MPRKIRNLIRDYRKSGAKVDSAAGKGSHRKITHPNFTGFVILSGKEGADAKPFRRKTWKLFWKNRQVNTREIDKLAAQFKGSIKWSEPDQAFVGRCPELFTGGCHGESRAAAAANLREAIRLAVKWHLEEDKPLPSPMKRAPRFPAALAARKKLGVSQKVLAETLGVKIGTLQNWEQGRIHPPGPARLALKLAEQHPEIFQEVARQKDN